MRAGTSQGSRRLAAALTATLALAVGAGVALAGGLPPPPILAFPPEGDPNGTGPPFEVEFATSGNHSELVETVPITTAADASPVVAMSINPDRLPDFQAGDRLEVLAEIQPSTTCVIAERRCIGRRYRINPFIRTRLVLADAADPAAESIELAAARGVRCTQKRPNRNHHCTIVFREAGLDIPDLNALPCPPDACYINLLIAADHRKAKPGNRIVLGADKPNGEVAQDRGRINAVIAHQGSPTPTFATDEVIRVPRGLRLHPRPGGSRKRVIHSIELPDLQDDDVLKATATFRAKLPRGKKGSGGGRRRGRHAFNVFLGSDLILADEHNATAETDLARTGGLNNELAEGNGFNCTQRASGYRSPCFVEKAGAIRLREDVTDAGGDPIPLYLNLVSRAKPKLKNARKKDRVKLRLEGGLRAVRYSGH